MTGNWEKRNRTSAKAIRCPRVTFICRDAFDREPFHEALRLGRDRPLRRRPPAEAVAHIGIHMELRGNSRALATQIGLGEPLSDVLPVFFSAGPASRNATLLPPAAHF